MVKNNNCHLCRHNNLKIKFKSNLLVLVARLQNFSARL